MVLSGKSLTNMVLTISFHLLQTRLETDSSIVEQAYKGTLRPPDTKSSYSMSSLLSMASPFVEGRLAIVGVVSARCKGLDGLVVNVSKRLWKDTKSLGARDLFLLKLGTNVTGEFFIEMDFIHVVLKAIK